MTFIKKNFQESFNKCHLTSVSYHPRNIKLYKIYNYDLNNLTIYSLHYKIGVRRKGFYYK